jgi:hypothetical protein
LLTRYVRLITEHNVLPISNNFNNNKIVRRSKLTRGKGKSANKSLVTKEQVKSMLMSLKNKVQDKFLLSSVYATVTPATTGNLVNVIFPAQGVANGQRTGDSLGIDIIEARVSIFNSSNVEDLVRILCLQARANTVLTVNAATVPATGILDLGSNGVIEETSFVNFNNKNELFHVLLDKSIPTNGANSSNASHLFQWELRPKIKKVNFQVGATNYLDGGIFWLVLSNSGAHTTIDLEQRLVYHDL